MFVVMLFDVRKLNVKGLVLEENQFMVKVRLESGQEKFIMFKDVLSTNMAKEQISQ